MHKKSSISVNDDNLVNSKGNDIERLWLSIKIGQEPLALGVIHVSVAIVAIQHEEACNLH